MKLTLRCPHCTNFMLYESLTTFKNKRKKCVFCGKSFAVNRDNISPQTMEEIARKKLHFQR